MTGLGVDRVMRRAGHDEIGTTMGYVKQAEDLTGDLGSPFGQLPASLLDGGRSGNRSGLENLCLLTAIISAGGGSRTPDLARMKRPL